MFVNVYVCLNNLFVCAVNWVKSKTVSEEINIRNRTVCVSVCVRTVCCGNYIIIFNFAQSWKLFVRQL